MAVINDQNIDQFIPSIEAAFLDIPFGESQFEIEKFGINAQLTPERAYRAIGERLMESIITYKKAKFTIDRLQVDTDELAEIVANRDTPPYTRLRAEIDIEEKVFDIGRLEKTCVDALAVINILYSHIERLPEYSRAEFEAAEPRFHNEKLNREFLRGVDVAKEIANIKQRNPALEKRRNGNVNINGGPK